MEDGRITVQGKPGSGSLQQDPKTHFYQRELKTFLRSHTVVLDNANISHILYNKNIISNNSNTNSNNKKRKTVKFIALSSGYRTKFLHTIFFF